MQRPASWSAKDLPCSSVRPRPTLDAELPEGGNTILSVPMEFHGFVYMLEGSAAFGTSRRRAHVPQLVLLVQVTSSP